MKKHKEAAKKEMGVQLRPGLGNHMIHKDFMNVGDM